MPASNTTNTDTPKSGNTGVLGSIGDMLGLDKADTTKATGSSFTFGDFWKGMTTTVAPYQPQKVENVGNGATMLLLLIAGGIVIASMFLILKPKN